MFWAYCFLVFFVPFLVLRWLWRSLTGAHPQQAGAEPAVKQVARQRRRINPYTGR